MKLQTNYLMKFIKKQQKVLLQVMTDTTSPHASVGHTTSVNAQSQGKIDQNQNLMENLVFTIKNDQEPNNVTKNLIITPLSERIEKYRTPKTTNEDNHITNENYNIILTPNGRITKSY